MAETDAPERIAKRLARAGVASRRVAETMIAAGRVAVNGKVIDSPALTVTAADRVTVDGKPLAAPEPARLWRYYKPLGLVTSERDEKGRDTVFAHLPEDMPRVMSDRPARPQLRGAAAPHQRRRAEAAAGAALDRLAAQVPGPRPRHPRGRGAGAAPPRDHRGRRALPADAGRHRPPAGRQRLADRGAARGPQPRGAPRARRGRARRSTG